MLRESSLRNPEVPGRCFVMSILLATSRFSLTRLDLAGELPLFVLLQQDCVQMSYAFTCAKSA